MKLVHKYLSSPITFEEGKIQVLTIENKKIFIEIVQELIEQSEGEDGRFVLSEDINILDVHKEGDIVTNYFNLDLSSKKVQTKLLVQMKSLSQKEFTMETNELLEEIYKYTRRLIENFDYPIDFVQTGDISPIFKALGVTLLLEGENILEKLIDYINILNDLGKIKFFALVNLKSYFNKDEIISFYETLKYKKISILIVENQMEEIHSEYENHILIDEDLCEMR